jgi:pimeloyl-ACP methyl ester carboxylesterase
VDCIGSTPNMTSQQKHEDEIPGSRPQRRGRQRRLIAAGALVLLGAAGLAAALLVRSSGPDPASAEATTVHLRTDVYGRLRAFDVYYRDLVRDHRELVRRWTIAYRAWNGTSRTAYVLLPRWYSPRRNPQLPLVISPHGRGITARDNLHFWGGLAAFGPFVVISPEGQGRVLTHYSWGWRGQIDDLARMPAVLAKGLPWVRVDRHRVYAVGSSMGGQETLLLVARHPRLLAGAAALDSDTDMRARYYAFARLRDGLRLQRLARVEIGGTPAAVPEAYRLRSPVAWAGAIARSGVPLHIWWSRRDRIVRDQRDESGRLYRLVKALKPRAPVTEYVGAWAHSKEFHASARLPLALVRLDLIRLREAVPSPDRIDRAHRTAVTGR